jgi:hypothetical protein
VSPPPAAPTVLPAPPASSGLRPVAETAWAAPAAEAASAAPVAHAASAAPAAETTSASTTPRSRELDVGSAEAIERDADRPARDPRRDPTRDRERNREADASAEGETGELRISSTPACEFEIDGRPYGSTPKVVPDLAVGRHRVRLFNAEFCIDRTYAVTIRPDQSVKKRYEFPIER